MVDNPFHLTGMEGFIIKCLLIWCLIIAERDQHIGHFDVVSYIDGVFFLLPNISISSSSVRLPAVIFGKPAKNMELLKYTSQWVSVAF